MSGIAGTYHLDRRAVDRALLTGMLDCIPHRGPDAARLWVDGFIGLGHRQLCTTEESLRELQPARNREGTCWVTLDGRLDNRDKIIDRLKPRMGTLTNPTDVELLLHAYDVWGINCLNWLIGDFAFALWDSKNEQLFCGRDTYGIRPFYYHFDGKTFTFGSECIQLFQNPSITPEVDQEKIAEWFTWCGIQGHSYRDLTRTYFRGISELPFAHGLVINSSGLRLHKYWDINPHDEIRYRNKGQYYEHFLHLFREAVRCRLRSIGPAGAELSGGFDSSSIVCVAQEIYRSGDAAKKGLTTFSMVFDELACDERPRIQSVLKKYPSESRFVVADDLCGLNNFPLETDCVSPIDSPDQFVLHKAGDALYRLALEQKIRVMLSGEGAENHVIGTPFVIDSLLRHRQWRELWKRLWIIRSQSSFRGSVSQLVKYGLIPLTAEPVSRPLYSRWMHQGLYESSFPGWLTPSFRDRISDALSNQRDIIETFPRFRGWGRQLEYESLNPSAAVIQMPFPLPLERRFPYHDRRLMEFCLALPGEVKYEHLTQTVNRNIRGRALQRHGLQGILPEEIHQSQVKVNFGAVYRRRFQQFKSAYLEMFAPPTVPLVAKLGYLEREKFWRVLSDFLGRTERSQEVAAPVYLWINRVTQLEIWLQTIRFRTNNARKLASPDDQPTARDQHWENPSVSDLRH